jgi:hypothetical protein
MAERDAGVALVELQQLDQGRRQIAVEPADPQPLQVYLFPCDPQRCPAHVMHLRLRLRRESDLDYFL